jgi:hypothetical protein
MKMRVAHDNEAWEIAAQKRLDLFDEIILQHPRLADIEKATRSLIRETAAIVAMNEARLERAKRRPIKLRELWVLPIIGPSGAMKSTSIGEVVDRIYQDKDLPDDEIPVLLVTMRDVKNTRALQAQILEKYDDAGAAELRRTAVGYNADLVNEAIRGCARKKKTSVIAIDEAHEMLTYDGGRTGPQMAKLVKSLVNEGIFSVILLGTDAVKKLFTINSELMSRNIAAGEISLTKFDITNEEDRKYFFGFVRRLETRMLEKGVIDAPISLTDDIETRATIFDMADGILGTVSRVLRLALRRAHGQKRHVIEWDDIREAFQGWNSTRKEPGFDPFVAGPQFETLANIRAAQNKKSPKAA